MCLTSSPKYPAVPTPTKPQEARTPDASAYGSTSTARKNMQSGAPAAASTLLTGPSGVENRQLQLNKSSLLGM